MRFFLCGQTGNINRGCEAIVRSTISLLNQRGGDIYLATFKPEMDAAVARELGINVMGYGAYPTVFHRYACAAWRKVFRRSLVGRGYIERPIFEEMTAQDICLNIGGDTYCYGRPEMSYALNRHNQKHGIKTIFWCCSVEERKIDDEMREDLKRYQYIFAREAITYQTLLNAGIDKDKVIKCCDPAFFLQKKEVELPRGFIKGNTVGINLSELVIRDDHPEVYQGVKRLISHILESTNMNICLIPHVYSIEKNQNDYPILKRLHDEFQSERISLVDQEFTCEQLKYIISNCRFFIGARTHSTIAAYSTEVPTIVLGYSVKSKGIATDLFGSYQDYVLPYDEICSETALLDAFLKLVDREDEVKERYRQVLPAYRQSLTDAIAEYILPKDNSLRTQSICDEALCTGCAACAAACPVNAIQMRPDREGFARPSVNADVCVNCGLCSRLCPSANPPKDDGVHPTVYAAVSNDENERMESSSGGVFSLLAKRILADGGIVCGAAFDDNFTVVHKICTAQEELDSLRTSKYSQSDIEQVYAQIRDALEDGKKVLFTGTPCQIAGVKAYLNKDYEMLYMQDLICHGVPSPKVFAKYLKHREKCAGAKAKAISFRDKRSGWKTYSLHMSFENDTTYTKKLTEDPYMRGFVHNLYLRPSCSRCLFKQVHRQSDLTLADFWGVETLLPEWHDGKGTSLVLTHSKKGEELLMDVSDSLRMCRVDYEPAIRKNSSYTRVAKASLLRKAFFAKMEKGNIETVINRYCGLGLSAKIRRKLAQFR